MRIWTLTVFICLISLITYAEEKDIITERLIKAGIVVVGMSPKEVCAAIGEPFCRCPGKDVEIWWYPDRKFIYFRNGKVTKATYPLGPPRQEL